MKCTYSLKLSNNALFERCIEDYVKFTTPSFRFGAQKIAEDEYDVYLAKNDVHAKLEKNLVNFSVRYERYLSQTDTFIKNFSKHVDYCELIFKKP